MDAIRPTAFSGMPMVRRVIEAPATPASPNPGAGRAIPAIPPTPSRRDRDRLDLDAPEVDIAEQGYSTELRAKRMLIERLLVKQSGEGEEPRTRPEGHENSEKASGHEGSEAPTPAPEPATPAPNPAAAPPRGDIQKVEYKVELQVEVRAEITITRAVVVEEVTVRRQDPIVLDLDGDGVELTSIEGGARWDLTGDGLAEQAATVAPDDAFLALDRDGNGTIDGGGELFGDQHGAANGFEELTRFDGNGDQVIDAADAVYGQLKVWRDLNGDGLSNAGELQTLEEAGIASISLAYANTSYDVAGNRVAQVATYRTFAGDERTAADVQLSYEA